MTRRDDGESERADASSSSRVGLPWPRACDDGAAAGAGAADAAAVDVGAIVTAVAAVAVAVAIAVATIVDNRRGGGAAVDACVRDVSTTDDIFPVCAENLSLFRFPADAKSVSSCSPISIIICGRVDIICIVLGSEAVFITRCRKLFSALSRKLDAISTSAFSKSKYTPLNLIIR